MKSLKFFLLIGILVIGMTANLNAQTLMRTNQALNARQQSIVAIAAFTAKGDLTGLQKALSNGLDAGLTINESKEVLVHLYAYCGFPRSIQGINTLMAVIEARKAKGITDKTGKEATPIKDSGTKYERGKKVLKTLTGQPEKEPKTGYAAFSPEIEVFLKEHLFADIFERDILNYADRELATISTLISLGGVEPMLRGHLGIGLRVGLTELQLWQTLSLIESSVGKKEADAGKQVLSEVIKFRKE
ncbi:carboxymuconolactone decarboxylase [Adhaeribacter arboris]|uniref:Carboxymuconolactone decarboxylase n=1 Tax=Adhaeribacter arboris TaxID=2072846 RepID=A0A2T2YAU7_9BACT|nr:carboxymuconolactone decarboxylase family protein [Adhaeribacter arboris]PSR52650.1 carboxymuconolactone decarboxylase [Adhaeribacter arboris]